jgi:hypothetical protein
VSVPPKNRLSRDHLNKVYKAWPDLNPEQQREYAERIVSAAWRHQHLQMSAEQQPHPISLQQETNLDASGSNLRVFVKQGLRRAGRAVFGDAEGGPVRVVEQILDMMVTMFGEEPTSRPGRTLRQLLAAAWMMLCVLMLTNLAQADRAALSIRAWSIVYGSLGLFYLILWLILVADFIRQRKTWVPN